MLMINAVFFRFNDRMLFALSTLNSLENGNCMAQNVGAKTLLSQKNDVQIVAVGNRQRTEIGEIGQCDNRRFYSSNR